jgi:hypothetical protein
MSRIGHDSSRPERAAQFIPCPSLRFHPEGGYGPNIPASVRSIWRIIDRWCQPTTPPILSPGPAVRTAARSPPPTPTFA